MKKHFKLHAEQQKSAVKGWFILKLATVALALMCLLPLQSFAQGKRISIDVTEKPMRDFLEQIEKLSGYNFFYNSQLVNLNYNITVSKKNVDVRDLVNEIFRNTNIEYKIVDKQIILSSKVVAGEKTEQIGTKTKDEDSKKIITGRILDELGLPLPDCSVMVEGTTVGTTSDKDGFYELATSVKDPVLIFGFIGMNTLKLKATTSKLDVKMTVSPQSIDQVVVTGYQTFKKFNSTGSLSVMKSDEIDRRSASSLERLLEGSIPGLTVYRGDYRIRGGSSLNAGTKPLFIVDDMEVESLPTNMDNVENITVLKDAAASAIWGSRAANGVIVITTKRGKQGDYRISYSNNFRISAKPNYDDLYRANSAEQISYEREALANGMYFDGLWENKSGYSQSLGYIRDFLKDRISESQMNKNLDDLAKLSNKDQIDEYLIRNAFTQNHLISISGATDKVNYYLSGSYNSNISSYVGDKRESLNINSRTSYNLTKFLTLRADINATFGNNDNGYGNLSSGLLTMLPYQMIKDPQGALVYDYTSFNREANNYFKSVGLYENGINLLNEANLSNNKNVSTGYKVRVGSDIKILEGVNVAVDFQKERIGTETKNVQSRYSNYVSGEINRLTTIDANNVLTFNLPNGEILDLQTANTDAWTLKAVATLNRNFGEERKHYVNAVMGVEARKRVTTSEQRRKLGYDDQLISWQPINQVLLEKTGVPGYFGNERYYASTYDRFGYGDNREVSTFASGIYTYDGRYTLSASFRFDESNLFGADKKFRRNPIYSFGVNWNISNEKFFNSDIINTLILRTTHGLTGNFDRSGSTTPIMVASRSYLASVNGYITRITTPPNPFLRWEKTENTNFSVELGLWNRLHTTVDIYFNHSKDLLGNQILDPTTGYTTARVNAANMKNRGIEVAMSGDIVRMKSFIWDASWIFAYNKNHITNNKISDGAPAINRVTGTTKFVEGYPREALWSYRPAPFDEFGNPMLYGKDDVLVKNATIESLISTGTYQPKYNGSLSSGLHYKTLSLNFMFVYNFGHQFRMGYPDMNPMNSYSSLNKLVANRWSQTNKDSDIPAMVTWEHFYDGRERAAIYSTNSIRSGDFIRLREILFNYELPESILKKSPFKRVSLTAQANTLWLWTANKENLDPEAIEPIKGGFSLREPKSFTFGIKLDF